MLIKIACKKLILGDFCKYVDITISNQPHPMEYLQASEELDVTEQLNNSSKWGYSTNVKMIENEKIYHCVIALIIKGRKMTTQ